MDFDCFTARDGVKIRYATAHSFQPDPGALVVVLNGRAEFIEKYADIVGEFQKKGFDVATLDWRGQGLSDRELANRHKGYIKDFNDYLSDLRMLFDRDINPDRLPVVFVAHSMGGHIALRFMKEYPGIVHKAVLISPMIDIVTGPFPKRIARLIAKLACRYGFSEKYVLGGKDYIPGNVRYEDNLFTHDREKFRIHPRAVENNPDLALGDVTWGWLHAAFRSIELLKDPAYAAGVTEPVLLVGALEDRVVDVDAQKRFADMAPGCSFVPVAQGYHELLFETKDIRETVWHAMEMHIRGTVR
ncbi:MAG: alpha/beta hydrolase [Desulfarculaceae bacterium]|nr:alpha/beta hydrolase [Desulfarculaceae bacterium]